MKTLIPLLLFVLIAATAPSFAQSEKAPDTHPGQVSYSDDEYDLLFEYPCGNATGEAGIETDGTYIYTSLWNGTEFCKYASDGEYLGTFSISGVANVRDMAYDGTYFYGAAANTIVFEMDFDAQILVSTIVAPTSIRGLAYDEYEDGFWGNNWSTTIKLFNRLGVTLNTIYTAGTESYYGFAYDPSDLKLWGYSQESGTSQNMLYKIDVFSGIIVEEFDVLTVLALPTPGTDIAGGLFFSKDLVNDFWILGGIVQNICLWGLELYPNPQGPQYDVGVDAFLSPTGGPYLGEEIVTIRVKNFSTSSQVISNIPVYYTLDGGTPVTGVVPGPISPGQTEDFTFPGTVNLSNPGQSYVFYGCTTLEGDDNPANDCKTVMIVGYPVYCDASTTNQQEYLLWVECGDIDKYSSWQAGVADYTDISTSLPAGWSEPISVTIENARPGDSVTVWTDWNQDFVFGTDVGEIFPLTDYDGTGHYFDGVITVPEDTPPGEYRMRIRLTYNSTPEPCGVAEFGEIEDYTIFVPAIPENDVGIESLISPPTNISPIGPGNKIVTIRVKNFGSSAQSDIPVSYTLDGGNPINGIIKGPVASGETLDYTFNGFAGLNTLGAGYNFNFCISLEGDENPANDCLLKNVNITWPNYIDASTQIEDEYIANVSFGSINNSSGWQGGVADYTDLYTIIPAGESETITVTNGNAWASDIVYAWVDWNNDFRFDHLYGTEEEYHLTNVGGYGEIFTGEIAVPDGQANGNYRMRVRMSYSTPPTPHGDATYGEVEDYTIVVDAVTPPQVRANPGSITQILEPDNTAVQTVALSNVGELPLIFDLSLTSGNKVLKLSQPNNRRQAIDVGLESILSPVSGFNLGEEIISIQVINFGTDAQSNIPVLFCIDDGDTISGIISGTVNSGDTVNYTFSATGNFSISGQTHCLRVCTTLEGDEITENDCKTGYIVNGFREFCLALTTTQDEYISNVLFGNINNSSGWQDSIGGFTNLSTTIEAGASENITITNGLPYTNDLVTAWVDWNKDFDFNAAGEQYILTNQNGTGETFTGEISVPENQPSGDYRLRIRMCYYTEPVPCGGSTYGEVEEYSIHVVNNQTISWLTIEPMTGVVNPNDSTTINVTFDATGLQTGTYQGSIVINSNDPGTPFTTIPVTLFVGQCPLPPPLNPEGFEILPNMAYLSWQAPDSTGSLLGYNVYRNNEKINPDIVSNLFYEDSLANPSQYSYFITAVYTECEASSDTISLVITNISEKENDGVRIFPNPAGDFINIQSNDEIEQITLVNNLGEVCYFAKTKGNLILVKTSDFPTGIFLLMVRTATKTMTRKLLIQR